jgi:LPXTG-motif cell wall-anchored protein
MNETLERDVNVARANVERDIANLGSTVHEQASNNAFLLIGAVAAIGLLLGWVMGKKKAQA